MIIIGTPFAKGAGHFVNNQDLRFKQEADVQTCAHCQAVLKMQEWNLNGAWMCAKEHKPLCALCAQRAEVFGCEPFLKKFEALLKAHAR